MATARLALSLLMAPRERPSASRGGGLSADFADFLGFHRARCVHRGGRDHLRGYSRDGKRGLPQIEFGLLGDAAGRPVAVRVFEGNTSDSRSFLDAISSARRTGPWSATAG